jgi:hypothetical protein
MTLQLFIGSVFLLSGSQGFFWSPEIYENYSTNECVNAIVRKFTNPFPLIYMIDTNLQIFLPVVRQNSSQMNFTLFEYRKPDLYIITERNNNLKFLLEFLGRFHIYNPRAKFIILAESTDYTLYFRQLSQYFIYGAVLLDLESNVVTSESFLYEDALGAQIESRIWKDCVIDNLSIADFFDKKLPSMWSNTTITAIYTQEFPYLAVHNNNVIGLFYDSFKLVKEKLQFEVTLMENSQEDDFNSTLGQFAFISSQSCNKSVLDQLKKRNATLALNFHQAMPRDFLNFDLLPINIFFNYFWVVPQARRLRSWDTFYRNFDRPTWLLVLLLLTILSVAKYYFRERDLVLAFLSYYQILLENSNLRTVQIKKTKIRMVISVSLLSFLVLSTSFKTAMVSSFTKRRYEHQISSLEDIVNLNLKCYATEEIKSSYGMSEDYLSGYVANCTTIHKKNKEDILKEIALKRSAAMTCRGFEFKFMLEKLYWMGYEKRLIALVPKRVMSDNAFMYFTKGHPLYDRFFTIAGRISNSGISNLYFNNAYFTIERILMSKKVLKSKSLKFGHVEIAIYILLGGLGISSAVFLLEICYQY